MLTLAFALLCAVATNEPQPYFQVETEIVDQSDAKHPVVKAPKVLVSDGGSVSIKDETKRAFVTAVKETPTGQEPVVKSVKLGVTVTVSATCIDDDEASLDLVIRNARVQTVHARPIDDDGSVVEMPTIETVRVETTRAVRIGEKTTVKCGDRLLTFVVRRCNGPASVPPLNAVDGPIRPGLR